MAPTTLVGQKTTTSPFGRDAKLQGYPVKVSELLATVEGAAYVARFSLHNPANIAKAKQGIKRAFSTQMEGKGFSLVELLSTCSTNWGMTPAQSLLWLERNMIPEYPLGEFKVKEGE